MKRIFVPDFATAHPGYKYPTHELLRANPALWGHVNAKGKGETSPRYAGTSAQDHLLNRRVEIRLLKQLG